MSTTTAPEILAVCWRNGVIEIVNDGRVPDGALPIIKGPEPIVRDAIGELARLAYDNTTQLVPGLPEARTTEQASLARRQFTARVHEAVEASRRDQAAA